MATLQAISRLNIASLVPLNGCVSYEEIARAAGMNASVIQRLLRHGMTRHIFCEPEPGMVGHTTASRFLLEPHMSEWMSVGSEEMWPAACKVLSRCLPGNQS